MSLDVQVRRLVWIPNRHAPHPLPESIAVVNKVRVRRHWHSKTECGFANFMRVWKLKLQVPTHRRINAHASMKQQKAPFDNCSRDGDFLLTLSCSHRDQFPFVCFSHALDYKWIHIFIDKDTQRHKCSAGPPPHLCINSSIHLFFNKETCGSVQLHAADRLTDFQRDNIHIQLSSLGTLHHSYFNNGFNWVLFLAMITYRRLCVCTNFLSFFCSFTIKLSLCGHLDVILRVWGV